MTERARVSFRRRCLLTGRGLLLSLAAALALLAGAVLLRHPLLVGVARAVEVREPVRPADLILLLNGDGSVMARAGHAAALYHRGIAPRILIVRAEDLPAARAGLYPNDTDVNRLILRRAGVPDSAVIEVRTPGGATSTTDEGRALASHIRRNPARRVLVVTSAFHTRRARWNVRRGLGDLPVEVRMAGAEDPRFDASNWWRSEEGLLAYTEEYLKFAHNWLFR